MDELEATGALEELLLHQHSLVDRTLYPLLEDAPLGGLVEHFRETILALQSQEPSFWQLQVVEYIQNVLKVRVGGCVRDAVDNATAGGQQDPAQVVARVKAQVEIGSELQEALKQLQSDVENEAIRLTQLLTPERGSFGEEGKHFVARFWDKLQSVVAVKEKLLKDDEERDAEGVEEFESCSFEMITFDDDLNDMSRSAVSFPCMDDFPATIMRMQSIDALERAAGLDELMQMPIVEIIHSGPAFPAACSAVVGLFLDIGICGEKGDTAGRAKRVVYDLMNQVEDAAQFLELYWAILDFMGYHLATGELLLPRQSICENCDAHTIAVLDCFRVFYALVYRVTQHWAYFSAEALAQLLVSIHESGFVADLLQSLSRLRPLALIRSTHPSIESIEKRFIQSTLIVLSYTCEYREGRDLVSRWQRLPAHAYIKQRRTTWERPILEVISADNDSSYHVVEGLASEEEQADDLEAEYERIGAGIVDALVLSIASIIATTPNDEHWSSIISKSVAVYLHVSHIDEIVKGFIQIGNNVSSVPAMLECSGLFSELKLLDFDGKRQPQRDVLPDSIKYLGPCSLLEKQLCYEYEFIGGSCEKLSRCELFEFDAYLRQTNSIHENARLNRPKQTNISGFSFTLQKKILRAIKDGVASGLSVPMDFVLISQASWELINDLEAEVTTNSPFMTCKPAGVFNKIFADLIHDLVMSRRSRLEPLGSSNIDDVDANSATTQGGDTFFPSDSERKLMNRLYKNYADGLTLDASPTLLHCIVKKFGKVAMDCFPVTILMMLHPTYDEADILRFLLHCSKSTSAGFLWPKSVLQKYNGVDGNIMALPATAIAAGVEIIIEREFPQVLEAIDQCHCSLLSLVVRWHSQNFWNYFDWENIVIYTYFSILYGAEFQVYIIVAILKHLEPTMRELTARHSSRSRAPFLTLIREPIRGFHFSPWRTFLLRLRSEYHQDVEALLFASE
ncbi:Protein broad-minded [Phytophthora ramorum]|uniref:Protein broad-minded n=1 Tax=Phytophthora ramorum TaxID=164328 RepID=UPI0030A5DD8D|nr:Protein broad-minded [Phytophthora ramorum]